MKVFQDAAVHGSVGQLAVLGEEVSTHAAAGGRWLRDLDAEARLAEIAGGAAPASYAFVRGPVAGTPGVGLFLTVDEDALRVGNIVPRPSGSLSKDQYNAALDDFVTSVLQPAAKAAGLDVETTAPEENITRWISPEAAGLLRRFSGAANKATGSSHPLDRRRWDAFLIQAHCEASKLDAETLGRWLVEEDGWPENEADRLAIQYEFGRGLLAAYDHK